MDAVSEVLVARAPKDDGMTSMLGASAFAHVAIVTAFVFLPAWWFGAENKQPETIMQISLGGPEGPDKSGLNPISSRAIQKEALEVKKAIEPIRPPAAKTPEMVEPTKNVRKVTPNKQDAKDPRSNKPTVGKEVQDGNAVANVKGAGFSTGLSGGAGGQGAYLDVSNFCCPEYLSSVYSMIKTNWSGNQGASATTLMRFVIQRDGRIVDISVEKSSGVQTLDFYAQRALMLTKAPPLPAAFPDSALVVHLYFDYKR
jgi:outer membrane biosynthesis protein TonB